MVGQQERRYSFPALIANHQPDVIPGGVVFYVPVETFLRQCGNPAEIAIAYGHAPIMTAERNARIELRAAPPSHRTRSTDEG